jgi:alkylresorcinol/alkylpyrone synthase
LSTRPYAHSSLHNGNGAITIAATSTALPPFPITYDETKYYIGKVFHIEPKRLDAMLSVITSSQIKQRYLVNPVERAIETRPLGETNREYQEHAVKLGRQVAEECLERADMKPEDIDLIITVSCTGFMIPSLDAHLINLMGFRADVRRLPITELGCAAGAMALTRAWEYIRGFPDANVLFGDGAAAAIVTGRHVPGPRILDTTTYLFPDSLDAMGFDLRETGLHIVLSKNVPEMIRQRIKGLMTSFLGRHHLCKETVPAFVLHPGGQKLMMYIEEELELKPEQTEFSWHVLREYGNLSSASVLFVLQEWMTKRNLGNGAHGVMASFGPGFSAELLLLQWP